MIAMGVIYLLFLKTVKFCFARWYLKDDNCVPPLYILQPISSHLPEFIVKQNKEKQNAAKDQWWKESDMMFDSLVTGAEKALTKEEAYTFKISGIFFFNYLTNISTNVILELQRVSDVEQDLITLTEYMRSPLFMRFELLSFLVFLVLI